MLCFDENKTYRTDCHYGLHVSQNHCLLLMFATYNETFLVRPIPSLCLKGNLVILNLWLEQYGNVTLKFSNEVANQNLPSAWDCIFSNNQCCFNTTLEAYNVNFSKLPHILECWLLSVSTCINIAECIRFIALCD